MNRQDEPALQEGFPPQATGVAKNAKKRDNTELSASAGFANTNDLGLL
ncbi:hypothetical protein [Scytonema sp. PCC 10023]